jgi:deoxyribodipyrimidine photo-lyase
MPDTRRLTEVVWFKRDLRVHDHAPLARAAVRGPVLPLYVFEPELLSAPDMSAQHVFFAAECLAELDDELRKLGAPLMIHWGSMPEVLETLASRHGPLRLWSHEETGNGRTFARDLRVRAWCRARRVEWIEIPQHGVFRGLRNRDRWSAAWDSRMTEPVVPVPGKLRPAVAGPADDNGPLVDALPVPGRDKRERQRGGRTESLRLLDSFLGGRATDYRSAMSSPLSATSHCSRLSPYLAFGTVSVREVAQALWRRRAELTAERPDRRPRELLASLKSFEARLHWRCHFIQKLESEPELEFRNMHRGYDTLRHPDAHPERLDAWRRGETGYPMVDACMRMLAATGWLNFRMRAMLVSFASYQLWLHWQEPALHLAREFLDYEPGIHYPQVQMQSGTTGINAIRMYNPVKQARDQDPEGAFVRRWIPELAAVPAEFLFEPWTMPESVQRRTGARIGVTYPPPIVDLAVASRLARERIHAVRRRPEVREHAHQVYQRHGSRNPAREGSPRRAKRPGQYDERQASLFPDTDDR